jgi:hypothetical protein
MTQTVAALFGHTDDTLVAWQHACVQAAEALRPQPDRERLAKALALAQDGAVTCADDGTATVQGHGPQPYTVRGTQCDCPDATTRGAPCKHVLARQIHQQAAALLAPSTSAASQPAAPQPASPAAQPKRQTRPRSSAGWDVHEAPTSSCFKIRVGTLEWTHTIHASDDAELHTRLQAFLPTFREIAAALEALHAEREVVQAAQATPAPQPPQLPSAPADLQALIQQAVQQALATQANGTGTPPANGTAPSTPPPAPPGAATAAHSAAPVCPLHQVPMEPRSNERGSWYSHWIASEKRYCKGNH